MSGFDPKKRPVYLDYHATTPVDPRVADAMRPYFTEKFGNPHSASHLYGWEAAEAVELAREQVASLIGAAPEEVFFTSGATEANNLALKGVPRFYKERKNHVVTCVTEHMCVLDSAFQLEKEGFDVTYLRVRADGMLDLGELADALTDRTVLVSVMMVQNEIGVVQDIAAIGALCREKGVFLHTDAAQAAGKLPIDVKAMNIDLLSLTAHKFCGPMGIGAIYIGRKPRVRLQPLFSGGGQEKNIRSGTLPAPLCVGFGRNCEIARTEMGAEAERVRGLRDRLMERLLTELPGIQVNGGLEHRVAGNLNISIDGVPAENMMAALPDVAVSSGSACTSVSEESSHVLKGIGASNERAESSIRFGLGRFTTREEIDYVASRFAEVVPALRAERGLFAGGGIQTGADAHPAE